MIAFTRRHFDAFAFVILPALLFFATLALIQGRHESALQGGVLDRDFALGIIAVMALALHRDKKKGHRRALALVLVFLVPQLNESHLLLMSILTQAQAEYAGGCIILGGFALIAHASVSWRRWLGQVTKILRN